MPNTEDYAILLGINHYPGLSDLEGPENDVAEFARWLVAPDGGDLDPNHVEEILSSKFPRVVDPNDANPTERALIRALDRLCRDPQRNWNERVGRRLYLFLAGHGFTAGASISDPALFSAVAQNGDTAHIAGYQYACRIANSGFFDEIVLVMDCCQDVLKASQVLDPTWSPPDRRKSSQVKLLQAYGAPRGLKAFERKADPAGATHGIFTSVLMDALRTALPDASGFVTGLTLKAQLLQIWGDRYKQATGYDPPVRPPDGEDIRLFRRDAAAGAAETSPVEFRLRAPVSPGDHVVVTQGSVAEPLHSIPLTELHPLPLRAGLYKATLSETKRSSLFEVVGSRPTEVEL